MANVYVEARPKGRPEGSRIDDYVVEDRSAASIASTAKAMQFCSGAKHVATAAPDATGDAGEGARSTSKRATENTLAVIYRLG